MNEPIVRPTLDWGVGYYERTAQLLFPAARILVDAAELRPGERVLDLGTGTGNAALLAAAAGAHVTAVDPSPRLLDVAKSAARKQGLTVACEIGEAGAIPSPAGMVDCLVSNFGVIFAPDPAAAVAEMSRVLGSAGRAVFTAWIPGGALGTMAATAQDLVRTAAGAPPASPGFTWHDESAVDELFSTHGLSATEVGRHELVFTAPSPQAYLDAERESHPMAVTGFQFLKQLGQAEAAHEQLLKVLTDQNEDPEAFRSTSRYVVLLATKR